MMLTARFGRSRVINRVNAVLIMAMMAAYYSLHLMVLRMEQLEQRIDRELLSMNGGENMAPEAQEVEDELSQYSFNFTIDMNNPGKCNSSEEVFLLILVTTSPENHRHRFEIRQTWGNVSSVSGANIRTVFAVGKPKNEEAQAALEKENALHHDIIQGDFVDSYRNLTLKTILCLKWAMQYCPQARYVMKADDDTFVSIFTLVKHLQQLPTDTADFVTGFVYNSRVPLRDPFFIPKWYVSWKEYPRDSYPKYPSGFGYVLSSDIIVKIYQAALDIRYFFLEDVYIGLCIEKLGISPVHHSGFWPEFVDIPSCRVDWLLASHWVKEPEVMLNHWAKQNTNCSLVSQDNVDDQATEGIPE